VRSNHFEGVLRYPPQSREGVRTRHALVHATNDAPSLIGLSRDRSPERRPREERARLDYRL
jgi:hypothetical protein